MAKKVAVIVGSLRKESWNRKLANALIKLAPPSLQLRMVEIGQLPIYNQDPDDENHPFPEWVDFRNDIRETEGLLFVTPEYNRSIPAPLKNAIDVGSRPYGKSVWAAKPGAVISASPGAPGAFGANHHLRQTFVFLDIFCMQQPEAYIGHVDQLFDQNGNLSNDKTEEFLQNFMNRFAQWVYYFDTNPQP
ncbi:NAD(P)H-dependent oxidoreductase [Legionella jordanis]|uniref:NADPH-dependent FMN reductase n=1 Tax=Legionella jordanis TaxID=456 RepID=UPI000EFDC3E9|nr:NAD(P)H-dependent oxidoreductase [Legionella jordanis]RMX15145.1 NAD(P)H-dependent oxidoreductase [Legionella jordanis]HAT8714853.1 NADPH-dependent FMN reductase [Legionella jordanis]